MTAAPVPAAAPPAPAALPRISGRDVLLVLGVTLSAMVVFALAGVVLAGQGLGERSALGLGILLGTVGAWAGIWATLLRRRGWGWRQLGFVPAQRSLWHLLWEVPAALLASLVGAALLGGVLGLAPGADSANEELADVAAVSPWSLLLVGACVVLVLPAAEEVLFRRVLLDWLLSRTGTGAAVLLSAVAFAAVHLAPVIMVYVVFLGLSTAVLRLAHGTLWAPLALHAVNNGLVLLVAVRAL